MQILTINSGSASLKYKVFDENLKVVKEDNIDLGKIKNHEQALEICLKEIDLDKIKVVGHRVVHGGGEFFEPTIITPKALKQLEKYSPLAPLHNPANILGIKASIKLLPKVPNIACFDTSYFKNLPERAKIYGLPLKFYKKYGLRRLGFHGLSHQYAAEAAAKKLKTPLTKLKLITCHLGGGSSITAVKNGRPIDTSMGFTPLEGLVMMTRCGDIDPGILLYLISNLKFKIANWRDLSRLLNYESGMKELSGVSEDMRDILKAAKKENEKAPLENGTLTKRAKLALDIYCYRIKKYIGAYFAILGELDGLVFTGAIGYGSKTVRDMIIKNLSILKGVNAAKEMPRGKVKILNIKPNEELIIARKVLKWYSRKETCFNP